jgi:hypothetical protein
MATFDAFHGEVMMLHTRLNRAPLKESTSPDEVRESERHALSLIDGYSGPWLTYPMKVDGGYPECSALEADFLRRHYRAMTELYAVDALQMPGENSMTRDEFAKRLRSLKDTFTWLSANVPNRLELHLGAGGYSRNLRYVDQELDSLGTRAQTRDGGGCYIATAVYRSYEAPEVVVLRRFRDETLRTSISGRAFIRAYYAVSPSLASHFARPGMLSGLARRVLDALVDRVDDRR